MTTGVLGSRTVAAAAGVGTNSERPMRPTGEAVAALLAAGIAMLTLAFVNQLTAMSDVFNLWVHGIGKLWETGDGGLTWAPV